MTSDALNRLVAAYRAYIEASEQQAESRLKSFEEECELAARARGLDPTALKALIRKRYYKEAAAENRRKRRQPED